MRIDNQNPSFTNVSYDPKKTRGVTAVKLYKSTGQQLLSWQRCALLHRKNYRTPSPPYLVLYFRHEYARNQAWERRPTAMGISTTAEEG